MILCDAQNDVLTGLKPLEPARQLNHAAPPEFTPATQPAAVDIETPRAAARRQRRRERERGGRRRHRFATKTTTLQNIKHLTGIKDSYKQGPRIENPDAPTGRYNTRKDFGMSVELYLKFSL